MRVDPEVRGGVAVLSLDNPPVNALGTSFKSLLSAAFSSVASNPGVDAIVIIGLGKHFSGGADIREFENPDGLGSTLHDLIVRIEKSNKPVIAAIHGAAVGGGLELALGCHYRIAEEGALLSFPEVGIGTVPGVGATARLPRLIGVEAALDMILNGRKVSAEEGVPLGLIDEVVPHKTLRMRAIALAERVKNKPPRRTRDLEIPKPPKDLFSRIETDLAKSAKGRIAPGRALKCVADALTLPFEEALKREREAFFELLKGRESRALRHVFFAEKEAQKAAELKKGTTVRAVRTVGVVGFGTMGSGIAMAFANSGLPVVVIDETKEAVDRGLAKIRATYDDMRAKNRISADEHAARMALVQGATEYSALSTVDLVIEAVFEEMDVKHAVFSKLDEVCADRAILATNTSTLDVNVIAERTKDPSRVLGLHFFSPANVMKLVEVVRPSTVSASILSSSLDVVKRIGKVGVIVGVCDGFVGNRMLYAYRRQADFLLEEGALPQQVDRAIRDFGMAMGPFQIGDLAGLDISWRVRKRQEAARPKNQRYSKIADRLCEMGRFGQKTGAGWYRYEKGNRAPIPDPEVEALVVKMSEEAGFKRREISDSEIIERCFGAMVNEGALILEEGIAERSGDIDVIWINGYGFPRHLGGPMHWSADYGLTKIAEVVGQMHERQGDLVKPSAFLRQLARDSRSFTGAIARP